MPAAGVTEAVSGKSSRGPGSPQGTQTAAAGAVCTGTRKRKIFGEPNRADVSTSYAERQNLTMPMAMRRFTRLTNGFSKKVDNHCPMVALYTVW